MEVNRGVGQYLLNITSSSSRTTLRADNRLLSDSSRVLKSAAPIALNEHMNEDQFTCVLWKENAKNV